MQMLDRCLVLVGDPCREVIELRYFGDLSYEEISRTLGLNVKTVSYRLSKCLDRLERLAQNLESRPRHEREEDSPLFAVQ